MTFSCLLVSSHTPLNSFKYTSSFVQPAATKIQSAIQVPRISITPAHQNPQPSDTSSKQEVLHTCSYPPPQYRHCPGLPRLSPCMGFPRHGWHRLTALKWLGCHSPTAHTDRDLTAPRMSQYLPVTERILKTCYRYVRRDTLTLFP